MNLRAGTWLYFSVWVTATNKYQLVTIDQTTSALVEASADSPSPRLSSSQESGAKASSHPPPDILLFIDPKSFSWIRNKVFTKFNNFNSCFCWFFISGNKSAFCFRCTASGHPLLVLIPVAGLDVPGLDNRDPVDTGPVCHKTKPTVLPVSSVNQTCIETLFGAAVGSLAWLKCQKTYRLSMEPKKQLGNSWK